MSKQGYVKRKNKVAIMGRHTWAKKYLVILPASEQVAVYDSHDSVTHQVDSMPFAEISSVQILPKKQRRRFNVTMQGGNVVALLADKPDEAADWVAAISEAHQEYRDAVEKRRRAESAAAARAAREAAQREREADEREQVAVIDVDAEPSEAAGAASGAAAAPLAKGVLVRMNATTARSVSAVSFMSNASAVSEDTFQSMRRMYFVLRANGTLTFFTDESRSSPLGFVEATNVERVETYKVPPPAGSADDDILDEPTKAEGVRLLLGEEHEVWELAVPESDKLVAADWVRAVQRARAEAAANADADSGDDGAAGAASPKNGAAAAAGGGSAASGDYQDVDLDAEKKASAGAKGSSGDQENDIKDDKSGKCHCVVM